MGAMSERSMMNEDRAYTNMSMNMSMNKSMNKSYYTLRSILNKYGIYGIKYGSQRILNHFGKYFVLPLRSMENQEDTNNKMVEFLHKYIPSIFDNKVISDYFEFITSDGVNDVVDIIKIPQIVKLQKIDTATYMYINTLRLKYDLNHREYGDLYIFGRKSRKYIREVEKILRPKDKKKGDKQQSIYTVNSGSESDWNIILSYAKVKEFEQLFYSHNETTIIQDHIANFMDTYEMYKNRGIPYKTGILLYGKPGTGKTSIINAICTKYNRKMVNINVNNIQAIDLVELSMILDNDPDEDYVVVFEDIDTLFLKRDEKANENKDYYEIIQKLLQFLDGVSSPNNVIFIATTNYKDRLDDAIIREGRFDLKIEIKGLLEHEAIEMVKTFGFSSEEAHEIIKEIDAPDGVYNQAKLQATILSRLGVKNFKEDDPNKYLNVTNNNDDEDED